MAHGDTYQLRWALDSGERYLGIGMISSGVLSVTYFAAAPGLVVYQVVDDSEGIRLQGQWTGIASNGGRLNELLVRIADTAGLLHFWAVPQAPRHSRGTRWAVW